MSWVAPFYTTNIEAMTTLWKIHTLLAFALIDLHLQYQMVLRHTNSVNFLLYIYILTYLGYTQPMCVSDFLKLNRKHYSVTFI